MKVSTSSVESGFDLSVNPQRRTDVLTLLVAATIHGSFILWSLFFTRLPLWFAAPFGAILLAWYGSLQHETIHGHPTPSRRVNAWLAGFPYTLWIPYAVYRETHWQHHRYGGRRLTQVGYDPESFYAPPGALGKAGPIRRAILHANTTLGGRMLLGPAIAVFLLWSQEIRILRGGDFRRASVWLRHLLGMAAVLTWIGAVCHIPLTAYLLWVVYPSISITLVRSFAEHRADELAARRTNVVEAHPWWALIFLNNNLHVAHHAYPGLPWHRLPRAWKELQGTVDAGVVFKGGYAEVFRKHFFRPFISAEHPSRGLSAE